MYNLFKCNNLIKKKIIEKNTYSIKMYLHTYTRARKHLLSDNFDNRIL